MSKCSNIISMGEPYVKALKNGKTIKKRDVIRGTVDTFEKVAENFKTNFSKEEMASAGVESAMSANVNIIKQLKRMSLKIGLSDKIIAMKNRFGCEEIYFNHKNLNPADFIKQTLEEILKTPRKYMGRRLPTGKGETYAAKKPSLLKMAQNLVSKADPERVLDRKDLTWIIHPKPELKPEEISKTPDIWKKAKEWIFDKKVKKPDPKPDPKGIKGAWRSAEEVRIEEAAAKAKI